MTLNELADLVMLAMAPFPTMQEKDPDPIIAVWDGVLADITYPEAKAALFKVLRKSKFFPTPAEIVEAVEEMRGTQIKTGEQVWEAVRTQFNPYNVKAFDDPLTQSAVKSVGYMNLCLMEEVAARKMFIQAYNEARAGTIAMRENNTAIALVERKGGALCSGSAGQLPTSRKQLNG